MKKVMTIVGTRPEIIKLSRVIAQLEIYTEHTLVHTGQNYDYELNEIFFNDMQISRPHIFLEASIESPAATIADIIRKSDKVFEKEKPDCVLVYGDTNSCLAVISAKRKKIPVFHMEAGNRCFDQRVPEEINRKIIDHLSDINMTLTEHARRYLISEGIKPETIIKTGSSMREVLDYYAKQIDESDILSRMKLNCQRYFVVSIHREENVDDPENLSKLVQALNLVANTYEKRVIISTHPRTRDRLNSHPNLQIHNLLECQKPLGFFDYISLQTNAFCVLSDSGTITEESSILGFPAITLRQTHERPEGMDEGTLIMAGLDGTDILNAINIVTKHWQEKKEVVKIVNDYDVNNVSKKVLRIIISYIDYVNRTVWKIQ